MREIRPIKKSNIYSGFAAQKKSVNFDIAKAKKPKLAARPVISSEYVPVMAEPLRMRSPKIIPATLEDLEINFSTRPINFLPARAKSKHSYLKEVAVFALLAAIILF